MREKISNLMQETATVISTVNPTSPLSAWTIGELANVWLTLSKIKSQYEAQTDTSQQRE